MTAALSFTIALILASPTPDQTKTPATRPSSPTASATRPASAPTTRPARANAYLPPGRLKQYRAALADLKADKNPNIQAARRKLEKDKQQQDTKYDQEQTKNRDKANQAAQRENLDLRRRRADRAINEAQKVQEAQRNMQTAAAQHEESQRDYARTMTELGRLERAWAACREYALDLEYQQWHQADVARNNAEAALARRTSTASTKVRSTIEPIEQSIRDELQKLDSLQDKTEPKAQVMGAR
jgi:hypothetical protein